MRFVSPIDIEIEIPDDWDEKVQAAWVYVNLKAQQARDAAVAAGQNEGQVENAVKTARKKAITAKSKLWSDAGKILRKIMSDKCWYCETEEIRSDMPVDHFRPKGKVAESANHDGYWWLAFNWGNFRYSCTFCNSRRVADDTEGGKQDHFPLLNPGDRVFDEEGNTAQEHPVLLDPCELDDVKLLTFHPNGRPREVCQEEEHGDYIRANKSIELYHLDHHKAVRQRKLLANSVKRHVAEVDRLLTAKDLGHDDNGQIKFHKKEIIKLTRSKAMFCTAARLYLQQYKNREWVQEILDRHI